MTETTPPTLDMALSEVATWVAATNYEQALARCNELNAIYPDSVRVLRARAQANELAGNFPRAIEDYTRALDILPADSRLMIGLARCQSRAEQAREAAVIAQQALAYEPRDADALKIAADMPEGPVARGLIAVARSWFRAGLVNRALSEMRRVNHAEPDRTDLQVVLVEMLWRNGLKVTTVELCQSILDEQPECLNAHVILSALWAQMGNRDIAQAHTHIVDRLDPDHRATYEWLGDTSPFTVADVPAHPEPQHPPEPEQPPKEDVDGERDRSAWVNELIAATGPVTGPNVTGVPQVGGEEDDGQAVDITPLEWTPAVADSVTAEDMPAWLATLKLQPVKPNLPDDMEGFGLDMPSEHSDSAAEDPRVVSVTHWSPGSAAASNGASADATSAPADSTLVQSEPAETQPTPAAVEQVAPVAGEQTPATTAIGAAVEPAPTAGEDIPASASAPVAPAQPVDSAAGPEAVTAPPTRKRINRRRPDRNRSAEDDKLTLARQAIEAGQYDQAIEHYGSLIAADTQLDIVLADLDKITHARPEIKGFHKLLGNLYERKGEVNAALMAYHRALDKN